jgi:transposase
MDLCKAYPTDLDDRHWALRQRQVPGAKPGSRPVTYPKREILDALFCSLRGGCAWRLLSQNFLPWQIVYQYFSVFLALAERQHLAAPA